MSRHWEAMLAVDQASCGHILSFLSFLDGKWREKAKAKIRSDTDAQPAATLEEAMWSLRVENYVLVRKVLVHVIAISLVGVLPWMEHGCGSMSVARALLALGACAQILLLGSSMMRVTVARLRAVCLTLHVMLALTMATSAQTTDLEFAAMQGLQISSRFFLIFQFFCSRISVPFQFIFSAVDVWTFVCVHGSVGLTVMFSQFFVLTISVATCVLMEGWAYMYVQNRANADAMISGYRRMLRGFCDGEVLLDDRLRILGEAACLRNLLPADRDSTGLPFQQFLCADDPVRTGFSKFIKASTQDSEARGAPRCLRTSLAKSSGARVGADVFHVAVPHGFGRKGVYHLLALKEDGESVAPPAAEALPCGLRHAAWPPPPRTRDSEDVCSGSSASSVILGSPELQEATLLFDIGTELHDVTQAHLKFRRETEEPDLKAGLDSTMPSLGKFMRPADWLAFRAKVERFVEKMSNGGPRGVKNLSSLKVQLPQDPCKCLLARSVQIMPLSDKSVKNAGGDAPSNPRQMFWLHLKDIVRDAHGRRRCHRGTPDAQPDNPAADEKPGEKTGDVYDSSG